METTASFAVFKNCVAPELGGDWALPSQPHRGWRILGFPVFFAGRFLSMNALFKLAPNRGLAIACLGLALAYTCASTAKAQVPAGGEGFLRDFSRGPSAFPFLLKPYMEQPIPQLSLENTPRIKSLIHNGNLELSLTDALALVIENNLDIAVQR